MLAAAATVVVVVADAAHAAAPHAAMTAQNPVHVRTDSAPHKANVVPPKAANARHKAKAAAVPHKVRCLNNVVLTTLQLLLALPAASATPMACVLRQRRAANLTRCAPAWTAWPQAVAVAQVAAVVTVAAAVAAVPVVVAADMAAEAAVVVPAAAVATVVVVAQAAAAVTAAK